MTMKNTIIKTAIIPAAALLLTACSEAERKEDPQGIATLHTMQSTELANSPSMVTYPIAEYRFLARKSIIWAKTTDGKVIYSSAFTLILNK